ncbi:MAG: glutathione S-transferase family protein, partial [Solimonas sp.]
MKIYWFKAQAPQRVTALVKHLGLDAECIEVDVKNGGLRAPDYVKLNPNMKAPTLVDGDKVLWEASAIMAYLCIKAGSDMWPAQQPDEQVEVLRWLSWNDCHWVGETGNFYFEHLIKPMFNLGEPDRALLEEKKKSFRRYAKVLDGHLAGRDWAACGRLTIADFQLGSMARYWREAEMPMQEFPHIVRWLDTLMTVPAWA